MRQSHLANILEGGVTGRVTCRFKSDAEFVDEDGIVNGFLMELNCGEGQTDGSESNLSLLRLGLSYVRRSNGIVLYFHFCSREELQTLRTEFERGSLRQKVEKDVNDLTTFSADKVKLTMEWPDHDYQRCALYFTLVSSTTVNDLSFEMLDVILQKAIEFAKLFENQANHSSDVKFLSLASVSGCWSKRLSKSVFKKAVHRHYTVEIQKVKKRSAILRNNSEYLVKEIQPNELIHHLIQSGCLTEKQASSLRRFRNDIDKNSELLRMARSFTSQRHFQFVECLYQTNQLNAARIVEKGGVVRRMCAKLGGDLLCQNGQSLSGALSVTSLEDKIYVAYDSAIYVYEDKAPHRSLENKIALRASGIRYTSELVGCQVHKCIYIVDQTENCIWKMKPADNYQLRKWMSEPLPKLSVSSDGWVLILEDDLTNPKLRIYTSDAILESTVSLRGDSYMYSWTAVELMPGVVAVQYENFGPRGILKGISIMRLNATGDILRDVECERIFRLVPYSAGRLIAVDQDANKVLLLDDQLKPLQVILSNENRGTEWPRCFCYRKDTREFIVNHFGYSGVIGDYQFHVYKLSFDDE